MKKLNKFCAILFAMLGVSTLSAQTDVTSTYLTNAGFDDESGWITGNIGQATVNATTGWTSSSSGDTWYYGGAVNYGSSFTVNSVTPPATNPDGVAEGGALGLSAGWGCTVAYSQEVTLPAGIYTISYKAYNANTAATQATNLIGFVSASTTAYGTITSFEANKWTEEAVTFTLVNETTGKISVGMGAISGGSGANAKLFVDGVILTYKTFQDVTPENPVDLTSMVSNAQSAWTGATECPNYDGISMPAVYKGSDWTGDALSQTINGLPVGKYKMEAYCQAHSSWDTDAAADGATGYTYLCANEYKLDVLIRNADGAGTKLLHTFEDMSITGGTLKISVVNEKLAANWLQIYVKSLVFLGPDKTLYEEAFNTKYTSLSALDTEAVPTAFATKIINLKAEYSGVDATGLTLSVLEDANVAMDAVLNVYEAVAAAYASYNTLLVACESIHTNSDEYVEGAKTTFRSAIDAANTSVAEAETADAVSTVYNTLETARQTYVQKADPTNGTFFDYTFKITNPGFDNGTNGWACESGAQNKGIATNKTNGIITGAFFENWNGSAFTGSISQSVAGLPGGKYTFKTAAFGNGTYVFANDGQTSVTTADGAWFEVEVGVTDGNLTFGLKNDNAINWMGIDNASLYFYGYDVATAQTGVTSLKSQAEALVAKPMGATVLAALNDAIANADATKTTRNELEAMTAALNTAIADANASITDYEKILTYITKANGIDASIAADYRTQYDEGTISETAETVFQKLEVATYNYVMSNFTYPVALSDTWNSTGTNTEAATFNNEHWSGTTRDYKNQKDGTGMGWQASAWTIDFDQEVTLPAGKYVFKVAGRKSADATLSLVVTQGETTLGTVNDFPSSNNSVGINKAGATSFDANDAAGFANNGNGFGWQWRYVMFELDAEATVKVAVHAETNVVHQWVSFGDYTLQMTEETYLEANKGGVEAAEAVAQALVNTKPMGDAENAALQEALDMTYTTGAEMLAKIETLETAVANANAWVTAYNEAKAPLVDALERFEADYNDGENGAKDHMAKIRWETVLEMVQAAAVAKDVTNSYEGFAAATESLVVALDAATVSVNEYAALDEAIKSTNALLAAPNWGDEPFQRPESAKVGLNIESAKVVYDAAEVEGEALATVTEALNAAMDITLNVPEGIFYLNVASEGHELLGKSVVATLGATGANNPTGYGFSAATVTANYRPKVFTFEQVEGNLYHISVEMEAGTVYLTYGSLNGSAAGWATSQIQGTTDVEKAGTFKIEASPAVEGAFRIYNTVANNYIDCQNGGSLYTDDGIQSEDFAIADASTVSVDINITAENQWSTCVLLFDVAELPEGLRAFKSSELTEGSQSLVLEEVTVLEAYTPYILYAQAGYQGTLTGSVDFADYVAVADDGIALKGAVEEQAITEGYILQNQGYGMKFYKILNSTKFTIPVGKCWLEVNLFDAGTQSVTLIFKEGTTGIEGVALDIEVLNEADGIYTIDGKRVSDMQKGQIYVVGGQKAIKR